MAFRVAQALGGEGELPTIEDRLTRLDEYLEAEAKPRTAEDAEMDQWKRAVGFG